MKRIVVNPPQGEARRDRVERKLFEQLAAVKIVERADSVIPPEQPRRARWLVGGAALAAAAIALILYPWAPWQTGAAHFVNFIGSTMGPIFGIMMVDYYLIRQGKLDVNALYQEDGEFRFQGGMHINAFIALAVGMIFSSILPTFTSVLPAWWGTYGWFFGVGIGGAVYYLLRMGARQTAVA